MLNSSKWFLFCMGRGEGHLLVSCVPMRELKKNGEKRYSFRAGQCAALSSLKNAIFVGKWCVFYKF